MTLRFGSLRIRRILAIAAACAVLLAAAPFAEAGTVNIDFGPTANVYSGQGALPAPGDVWNAHAGGFPAPPVNNLLDSTGATTSVGIEFVAWNTAPGGTNPPYLNPNTVTGGLDAPHPLFADAVRNGATTSPIGERAFGITLTGLTPLRPYDLAFYAAFTHPTTGLALAQVEISDAASFPVPQGSTVPAGTKATTGMGVSGFEENVNYVLFEDVFSDANGKIYANVWSSNSGIYTLNAIQIQEVAPEPASTALLGIGGMLLLACRSRK